jgi:hypothetical protein
MTDLTEQWKKGELPEGHYYIKTHNETNIDEYIQWYKDHGIPSEKSFAYFNVQQVLAPVPSYEEYLSLTYAKEEDEKIIAEYEEENARLKKQINHLLKTQARQFVDNQKLQVKAEKAKDVVNIDTARQIKQLKDLLKECKTPLEVYNEMFGNKEELLTKIDEALQ